jgi:sulfur-oxidizing protein SoxY
MVRMGGGTKLVATRREFVLAAGAFGLAAATPATALAQGAASVPRGTAGRMEAAIRDAVGGKKVAPGKVKLDVPPLIENGNVVPVTVAVESPMTEADYVKRIHLFNEKNPQPYVATFHLGPRTGKASVATRIRLADSQKLVAIAELADGTLWSDSVEVIVTLAACVEG